MGGRRHQWTGKAPLASHIVGPVDGKLKEPETNRAASNNFLGNIFWMDLFADQKKG